MDCKKCPTEKLLAEIDTCKFTNDLGPLSTHIGYVELVRRLKEYDSKMVGIKRKIFDTNENIKEILAIVQPEPRPKLTCQWQYHYEQDDLIWTTGCGNSTGTPLVPVLCPYCSKIVEAPGHLLAKCEWVLNHQTSKWNTACKRTYDKAVGQPRNCSICNRKIKYL